MHSFFFTSSHTATLHCVTVPLHMAMPALKRCRRRGRLAEWSDAHRTLRHELQSNHTSFCLHQRLALAVAARRHCLADDLTATIGAHVHAVYELLEETLDVWIDIEPEDLPPQERCKHISRLPYSMQRYIVRQHLFQHTPAPGCDACIPALRPSDASALQQMRVCCKAGCGNTWLDCAMVEAPYDSDEWFCCECFRTDEWICS